MDLDDNDDNDDDDDDDDNSNDDDHYADGWNGDYEYMELENVTFDLSRFFITTFLIIIS